MSDLTLRRDGEVGAEEEVKLALVLTGGGARAAYQAGLLAGMANQLPGLRAPILTGVSAGAINAAFIASHRGNLRQATADLADLWRQISFEDVFRIGTPWLAGNVFRWGLRMLTGGSRLMPKVRGMLDTSPLRDLLSRSLGAAGDIPGIAHNLASGRLEAVALTTIDYATGRTVTWVEGCEIEDWQRPQRRGRKTRLTVDHILASAALPLVFPAVRLGDSWYGDGGIRLAAPLSPALHLGANRLLALSTRYDRSTKEASDPVVAGYPPPAQVAGLLMNAIFLDVLDRDVRRLLRLNELVCRLPEDRRSNLRPIDILLLRPSKDLGRMVSEHEVHLPKGFRFLTRGLGTRETKSPDFLSLLMFDPGYLNRLVDLGVQDAAARIDEIRQLVEGPSCVGGGGAMPTGVP